MDAQLDIIADQTMVLYAVGHDKSNPLYAIPVNLWEYFKVQALHRIYDEYFLIEIIDEEKEQALWSKAKRIVLFTTLQELGIHSFVYRYLEQITNVDFHYFKSMYKQFILFIVLDETKEKYQDIDKLIAPLDAWTNKMGWDFLQPIIVDDLAQEDKVVLEETLKHNAAKSLLKKIKVYKIGATSP